MEVAIAMKTGYESWGIRRGLALCFESNARGNQSLLITLLVKVTVGRGRDYARLLEYLGMI